MDNTIGESWKCFDSKIISRPRVSIYVHTQLVEFAHVLVVRVYRNRVIRIVKRGPNKVTFF